jgi:MFS family permease
VRRPGQAYARYVLGVLLAAYAFNFLDRQVLSIALESIKADLQLSDTQLGVLTGAAFAIFYSIAGMPIARWADRGDRPVIISAALGVLSMAVALCSVVGSFAQLTCVRIGAAVGEAGLVPPAHSLVATYFDRSQRLRAMSIFLLGGPLSAGAGYLMGGWLTELFGWRMAFLLTAIPGVVLAVLVRWTIHEPRRVTSASSVAPALPAPSASAVLRVLWGQHTFRNLLIASTVLYLFGCGLVQWLPVFFIRVHHMPIGELGMWMAINWGIGNAIGTLAGGYLTHRRTADAERRQLRIMAAIAVVYVPLNVVALLSPDESLAMGCLFVAALINALATAPTFALIQSLVPEHMRATAVAAVFLASNLIGLALGPLLVGGLSDALAHAYDSDSLRIALLACMPGYWWVAAHLLQASRTVMADLASVEALRYE